MGESFKSLIDWVNAANFDRLRIGISDALNSHNHSMNGSLNAKEDAVKEGDAWLAEHEKYLQKLTVPYEIYRWSDWYKHSFTQIEANKIKYEIAFRKNSIFREALLNDMDSFFSRKGMRLADMPFDVGQHSLNYLIEELAVYEEIFKDYPCTVIYPGKQLKCFECIRNGQIELSDSIHKTSYLRLNIHQDVSAQKVKAA